MIMAIQMKWALLVLIVGTGGGSMNKVAVFDSEEECRMAQKNVIDWTTAVTDGLRDSHAQVGYNLTINCVEIPEESGPAAPVSDSRAVINPTGGGK